MRDETLLEFNWPTFPEAEPVDMTPTGSVVAPPPAATAEPVTTPAAPPVPPRTLRSMVRERAQQGGQDPDYMERLAQVESSWDPQVRAKGSTATGLFQFIDKTWREGGYSGDRTNAEDNTNAAVSLTGKNRDGLRKALGREPEQWELYMAHQQGLGGAIAHLTKPGNRAIDNLTPRYRGNRETATKAIVNNGGRADMTSGDFSALWKARWNGVKVNERASGAAAGSGPSLFSSEQMMSGYRNDDAQPRSYSFLDGLSAAVKHETVIGLVSDRLMAPGFQPDPAFRFTPEIEDAKLKDLPAAEQRYIRDNAQSEAQLDYLRSKAMDRMDGEKAMASQGLLGTLGIMLGAGALDLPGMVAGGYAGAALNAGRKLSMAGRIGVGVAAGAASGVPMEATKMGLNPSYDLGDAVQGIAMAGLVGGGFSALGVGGGVLAGRYRELASGAVEKVKTYDGAQLQAKNIREFKDIMEAEVGANKVELGSGGLSAATSPPPASIIEPTWLDRAAAKVSKYTDFSVAGRLYHSDNDEISALSTKLTTVATQTLTGGGRLEEGALDFVGRHVSMMNSRTSGSMTKNFGAWADERGLTALQRNGHLEEFYEAAQRAHTDPGMQGVKVNPHVQAFVDDQRQTFADMLDLAKAYGLKGIENIQKDDLYFPRYVHKTKWGAFSAAHGLDELENLVQQAIKVGQPELAKKVGSRIIERAATKDAEKASKAAAPGLKAQAELRKQQTIAEARLTADGEIEVAFGEQSSGLDALSQAVKTEPGTQPNLSQVTLMSLKEAGDEEVAKWSGVATSLREAAEAIKNNKKSTPEHRALNERKKVALLKEAAEVQEFSDSLMGGVASSFIVAMREFLGRALTPNELKAVMDYTGTSYGMLNRWLRGIEPGSEATYGAIRDNLDSAITADALPKAMPLWRGVKLDGYEAKAAFGNLKVGDIYEEKGFLSSSMRRDVAKNFALSGGSKKGVMFEFEGPQGALAATGERGQVKSEKEMIFPRGTRMQITETRVEGDLIIHKAKLLDPQMAKGTPDGQGIAVAPGGITPPGKDAISAGIVSRKDRKVAEAQAKAQTAENTAKAEAKVEVDMMRTAIKNRAFNLAFDKHLEAFEESFTRRMARNYVKTVNDDVRGIRPDVDAALSLRDTTRLKDALRREGVIVDDDMAEAMADMLSPRAQRGPASLRKRTVLDENLQYTPVGADRSYSLRDLMDNDYEAVTDRYVRSLAPAIIMAKHGFDSEAAVRRTIDEDTANMIGVGKYSKRNAKLDAKRSNYLVDAIYGKNTDSSLSTEARAIGSTLRNATTITKGGSFVLAQMYDAVNLPLRYGFDTMLRVAPGWREIGDVIKRGGPEAEPLIRDLQIFSGTGNKGQEGRIMTPNYQGLDRAMDEDLTSGGIKKAHRISKSMVNATLGFTGMNAMTDLQQNIAARGFLDTVGRAYKGEVFNERRLAQMGLDKANIQRFGNLLENTTRNKDGVIQNLNVELLKELDYKTFDELMGMMRRDAFTSILEPHAGLKPMWAGTSEVGRYVGQLKSFAFASHAVHSLGNLHLGHVMAAKALVVGAAWGSALYFMQTHLRSLGRPDREEYLEKYLSFENPGKLAAAIWDRSGISGVTPMLLGSIIEGAEFVGLKERDAEAFNSNARASGLAAGGIKSIPTAALVMDILDGLKLGVEQVSGLVTGERESVTRKEYSTLRRLLPMQNALGIGNALNVISGTFDE